MIKKYKLTYYNEIGVGSKGPHHPSYSSGVTIGCGYDLKHKTIDEMRDDFKASGISIDLSKAIGLKGNEASLFCKMNSNLKITDLQQELLFEVICPKYEKETIKEYKRMFRNSPDYQDLDENIKNLLFDFNYNLGSINGFPKFFKALMNGDKQSAFNNYKRFADGKPLGRRNDDTRKILESHNFRNQFGL